MATSFPVRALPQLTLAEARRLAVAGQRLLAPAPATNSTVVTRLVEQIGYLQRDPLAVVAPSHLLVLWSRLGTFDRSLMDQALWQERSLYEYWAHAASIIPTSDFPAHRWSMRNVGRGETLADQRLRAWMEVNRPLRRRILSRLRHGGPLPASAFAGEVGVSRGTGGWGDRGDSERMLFHLWRAGTVAIAGRDRRGRLWDLTANWLGQLVRGSRSSGAGLTEGLAERSLRALGIATEIQIRQYMGAGRYGRLTSVLEQLERRGVAQPVTVRGEAGPLPGRWWTHREDLDGQLSRLAPAPWSTTLLSPFDNLLIARRRTEILFGFEFRMEIYVPAHLRRYGYYVLPILHRDRLIGRVDLRRDSGRNRLVAVAVHGEPGAPRGAEAGKGIREALDRLAQFVGVAEVEVGRLLSVPAGWGPPLRR